MSSCLLRIVCQGFTKLPKNLESSTWQKGDKKKFPYRGPINIWRHRKKFSRQGNEAPGNGAALQNVVTSYSTSTNS